MAKPTAAFLFAAKLAMDAGGEASMPFPAPVSARSAPFLAWPTRRDFMNYAYDNPVWRAARATGRFFDGATDPKNVGNELSAGVNAASAGDGGAATAAAPAPAPAPEKPPQFEPGAMHYGLGGAGAGALLGAAMGRKGTRGRNALIGGALGGGAGLLAQHLMSQKKSNHEKQALVGTSLGVLGGAVSGRPGKRLSAVGRGAVKGLGVDVGTAAGGTLGAAAGGTVGGLATLPLMGIGAIPGAALGGIGGAVTGGRLGYNVANSMLGPYISDEEKFKAHLEKYLASQNKQTLEPTPEKRETENETENKPKDTSKKEAAFDFSKMLGDAGTYAKDMYNKVPESVRSGAGMGGLGGAALGGLAGLVAPGETNEYDEFGRVVGRKQRNRFGAMMRGAVGGGLAGAAGGAAAGHFAPQPTQDAANFLQQQGVDFYNRINPVGVR
jgi:hypothetical protein